MGKSNINGHVQSQTVSLPEGKTGNQKVRGRGTHSSVFVMQGGAGSKDHAHLEVIESLIVYV